MNRLHVYLPSNRNATGWLHVFGPEGKHLAEVECRGKADSAKATSTGNPGRDPTLPYGDMPSGRFELTEITPTGSNAAKLGPLWIPLTGKDGEASVAKINGREGLGIHGGRGDGELIATYGCLRLRDRDFALIKSLIGTDQVSVQIEDV